MRTIPKYHSTAMGEDTTASGTDSTAMGWSTTASGVDSTAMGYSITASEQEALAVSGNVHAKNVQLRADARLVADVRPANTTAMLDAVRQLQVVEHNSAHCHKASGS